MGRSKFPGKPSKSINRKRISVLQLDPNEHNSAGSTGHITTGPGPGGGGGSPLTVAPTSISSIATGAVSASSNASSSSSSSPTETAAATAHDSNSEDEEKSQTKSEEENNEEDQDESTVRAYDKYKNGKREEDDDDDDQRGNGNHKLANTNGQSEGSSIGGGHRQNGNRRSSSSSSQQQQQQQQNANAHQSKSLQNSKIPVPSLSAKVIASASNNTTSSTTTTTTSNPAKQTKKSNIQKLQEDSSKETANKEQETKEAKETAKKSNTPTAIATASSLSPSTSSSSSLPSLSSPNSTSTATVKFPPRNCKKFKNLNINKPEVMLPSSSKLKFQQQQKSITPTTAACSTTIAFNSKESAEPVQRLQQQPQQHSQKCEMSSSSTIPTTIPTTQTPTSAPATTTSVASTTTSSSSSRFNNNRLQQNAHHLDNNDDLSAVPKTRNNEDIDDDKNEHVRNPNHQHQNVGANNNDNNEVDHHVSKSSSQSPVQQHTANDRENHHHRHENDGKGEVAAVNVDGNSSSHNELKTTQTNSQQDSKPATESSIELNSDDRQKEECEESLKSSTSSSSSATTSSASATTPPSVSAVISIDMATTSSNGSSASTNNTSSTSNGDKKQKKTVTFKNVLETSDDKSAVKKFYNPDNRKPLISIIKKECLNRPLMYTRSSECIVRPSRLTEILKNNSNIDKLNSLKFRSNTNGGVTTTNGSERNSSSVLAGPLSRVFGAPREDEAEDQQNNISFRLTKNTSDEAAAAEEAEEDENNEDDENEDQEEEEDEDGGLDNPEEDDDEEEGEEQEEDETNKIFARRNTDSWTGSTTRDNVEKSQGEEKESKKPSEDESSNVIKSTLDRNEEEHQVVLDTHFVLPKRSSRSSRLIKPNKRLVEDSILTKKTSTKTGHGNASNSSPSLLKSNTSLQSNYFGLGDYNGQDMNGLTVSKSSKDSTATEAAIKPSAFAAATSTAFTNFGGNPLLSSAKPGSFILRQPRLQFGSLSTAASKSGNSNATSTNNSSTNSTAVTAAAAAALSASLPKSLLQAISSSSASASSSNNSTVNSSNSSLTASMLGNTSATSSSVNGPPTYSLNGTSSLKTNVNTSSSSLSPSSILCVVCSSPIHTKNLPQASKYGQLSCEYCRKFISKIAKKSLAIKNSATNKPIIPQCKGDGNCIILPLNKGIHIKNFKKLYKERCGLCWLKKCLNTLQLPKVRLNALIPVLNAVANNISSSSISSSNTTSSTITPNNNNNKLNTIESKLNKDLDNGVETNKLSIKWKPLATRETTSPITVASSVIASSLLTGSTAANMAMMDGLKIKTNPLSETMGTVVAFGASPLLRPAILEKSITALGKPMMAIETKQELVEKLDKKPLDILKEVKLELATEQLSPVSTASSSGSLNSSNTNKPNKRKDKASEKDRKEVKVKEMHSPKSEEKVRETKDPVDKAEQMENTDGQESNTNGLVATLNTTSITTAASTPAAAAADKRQRIDLKGPRVKHVCRSASIVLGQPLAMFGEDEVAALGEGDLQQNGDIKLPLTDENDNCASCKTQQQTSIPQTPAISEENTCEQPPLKIPKVEASSTPTTTTAATTTTSNTTTTRSSLMTTSKLSQRPHHYNTQLTAYKKQFSSQMVASASSALVPQRRKEPQAKCKLLISIDFWENYDPAEVCQTGFGLIITETVAQRALCFLCGSAGQEPLIFCACCCEPYHQYCVQDEFNLKHGSLDETLLLNDSCLSITGGGVGTNTAIAKLNWLCPRCTVCYTCNMSSGAKVRCQKCQKNYHSTCLGTSKRLLGADRPLICVNCLKCRSCSTTKVTKFVGNLPMCTNCFKLRKKGNYCPVCQKCYDDQDFDLKMMECGDCHQWVHAKCETLTDEQYNLLSTLPESIEFICKRCSRKSTEAKERACEWREAVKEEFQSNLMSVLKLLSKSRQACSLLRLSPRKQMKCSCGGNGGLTSAGTITKYQPKALLFNQEQSTQNGSSQSIDVYEFDDHEKDHTPDLINSQPLAMEKKCICQTNKNNPANGGSSNSNVQLSLVEIKQKIANHSYGSLAEFHYDMSMVIQQANCDELVIVYKELLSEQFPWFQNETQACTDALEEDMYESAGGAYGLNSSLDTESDYQMDCLPTANDHHEEAQRSALLAELPHDLEDQLYGVKNRTDTRICLFCRRSSEGLPNEEARLLYCGHDCWVHTNCALWSAEVFEEIDGSLQNVHSAVSRGRMIKCSVCGNRGATVGCNVKSCGEHYHYPCARSKNCAFLADKSMYCPTHAPSANNAKVAFETQFEVLRPVYVELERKRKKLVEPSKVQFHIGSLEVKQLGHILPRFSDTYEALVPVNFQCSRLYWSSKEPWKIVEYNVRTYIHNSSNSTLGAGCMDMGKNFTVDHSQGNAAMISVGLSQIQQWHMSLARGDYEGAMEDYDYLNNFPQPCVASSGGHHESSTANDEEPQTNADLLPPEIKEAIFEDLPGDLLEGISMLDIFTKCMNYEDMAQGEQTPLTDEDTMTSIGAFTKQLTAELNNGWPNAAEDALFSTSQAVKLQKLKKSSSPVISCDAVTAKNAIKRRKISENMLISFNHRSQKKECSAATAATRRLDLDNSTKRTFTWSAEKRYNVEGSVAATTNSSSAAAMQQSDSKIRIMQVDGVDDSITEYRFITQDAAAATAVKCERCQCTYRNIESFQRHIPNCEAMSSSTSESESDHTSHAQSEIHTNGGITLEQLQELNNKLQQQQQQQQRTTQLPFLQAIPTQTLSQLQGLQTLPMQLQNVQNLQNLQNLQQLQQLTQPQTLGGNFFISAAPAAPEVTATTPDLQLYANALQGLTANLANGTFTLQPTANTAFNTAAAAHPQVAANQPQLLALSTNADGTQQIIQLPAQQNTAAPTATYQTLHATNSDKKIILPVGGGKPMKTMATKAAQQAAAKNKLKATTAVKPIQSKINVATTATTTHHQIPVQQQQTVNATQLLNQQILQQLQQQAAAAQQQQQQASNAGPQIVFQQSTPSANTATQQAGPQIIMQQAQPQNIISFVTTTNDASGQPQFQYVTLPTNGGQAAHEYKPQATTLFATTTNAAPTHHHHHQPLMQSAYLQTDASGNLVLTNAPQTATPLQLLTAPTQSPQVIGTLIQPQTLQLQGGNVLTTSSADGSLPQSGATQTQQQVIISGPGGSGPTGLEMLTTANGTPQVILATNTPPMYYGLETIVQNTVMSSQQFVSTAMPGVLSQNASFSATTTQVFQASKIEPLVDIPAGYVLLNNVDPNNASILQPQQQQAAAAAAATASQAQAQVNQASFIQAALQQQAAAAASLAAEQQQHQQQQQTNVYRIQTPPVSTAQSFQLQPQIVVATPTHTPSTPAPQPPMAAQHLSTSGTTTQYVDPNTGTVYSAKVTPVAQVKRTKTAAATPVATVTKVQPQVVNKVMPNVAQITVQQQQQAQATVAAAVVAQQQKLKQTASHQAKGSSSAVGGGHLNLQQSPSAAMAAEGLKPHQQEITVTHQQPPPQQTAAPVPSTKKTNMIRPLNKAEVKPKVMKTAAATVVTKPATTHGNNTNMGVNHHQMTSNPNKMIILKPQQQQTTQQVLQQQAQRIPESTLDARLTHATSNEAMPQHNNLASLNSLSDNSMNNEYLTVQHVANNNSNNNQHQHVAANNHHQHYNVADALLLDESSSMAQQQLSHCSYSVGGSVVATANSCFESNSQQSTTTTSTSSNDSVSNILPTIQRMPQYTNINIVNPLQQYSSSAANTTSSSSSTTTAISSATTVVTRPTNRVLPMQQKTTYDCGSTSNSTTTTYNHPASNHYTMAFGAVSSMTSSSATSTMTTTSLNSQMTSHQENNNAITGNVHGEESAPLLKGENTITKIAYEAEVKQMLLHSPNPQQQQLQQDSVVASQQCQLQQQQQQRVMFMHHQQNQQLQSPTTLPKASPPHLAYDLNEKPAEMDSSKLCYVQNPTAQMQNYVEESAVATTPIAAGEECLIGDPKFPPEGEVLLGSDCCENEDEAALAEDNDPPGEDDDEEDDGFSLKMPSTNCSDNLSMDSDEPAVKEKISKILDNLTNEDCNDSLNTNTTAEAVQHEVNCANVNNTVMDTGMDYLQTPQTSQTQATPTVEQQIVAGETGEFYAASPEETSALIADVELAVENIKEKLQEKLQPQIVDPLATEYHMENCQSNQEDLMQEHQQEQHHQEHHNAGELTMSTTNPPPQPPTRLPKRLSGPHLLYEIQSEDGFTYKSTSIAEVWEKVFEAVQVARSANGLAPLPEGPLADMSGVQMIGLKTNALKYLIEQLPGVEKCTKYTPKYHKRSGASTPLSHGGNSNSSSCSQGSTIGGAPTTLDADGNSMDYASDQEELNENPYDCARCEPYSKRSEYDMFSWLASRHRKQPVQVFVQPSDNELVPRRGTGSNLPMAMKYRTLKETYKDYVGVFRSHIHGRGLYCTKDIEAGEMVIEYAGELIRSTLTDQRERYYNSRGIGCYMFKIDDNLVVDATMRGNAARFINHSCEPNCYSKVVDILGHKHIIIFALRRIVQGEELTYDYKFPFEDEKIPCSCGSKRCRKYLN